MPKVGQPSSTETSRLVFLTEATIVSTSSGRIVRRSITSAWMPASASASAARSARSTIRPKATIVTSAPSRSTFALPIGSTKSSSLGTSNVWP